MERAFQSVKLPLGAYQVGEFIAADLGEQFTKSGDEPRTLVVSITGQGTEAFVPAKLSLWLTEEAQRHLIALLEANLADDSQRARELITVFHPKYGTIT